MSLDDAGAFVGVVILISVFMLGGAFGAYITNYQHEYVSDDTIVKFRMAENITSNMTIKEKIELIKTACEDNHQRDACYKSMYGLYIEPSIGR